ncbi:substrate-binding domain-containing protein [Adhaeribacter aquaticus]|uniref:substrate-binding domain-containing protein n=1 Tax=Adhaeribacter aquaticus TaxID=299567 RepID=UPI00040E459B|nr:substrate-binding domain-containing protein [Adhaeribacter aquaticus]
MEKVNFKIGGVPEHFNLPWHLAMQEGLFEQAGLQLSWTDYLGGTGAMTKDLRSGDLDIAVLLTEGIVADIVKGNESKIIQVFVESPLNWGVHVPAQSNLYEAKDLEGKRVAISRMGSGSHLMAFVYATQQGWNPADSELVLVGGIDGARVAFKNNTADVFLWEKFMTKPLVDAGEFRRVDEIPTPWPCFVIAARQEIINQQAGPLKKLLKIINTANQSFKQNPEAVNLVSQNFNLQPADAQTWFTSTRWATTTGVSESMIQGVIDMLRKLELIDQTPQASELIEILS